jgi:hypothetical protein
MEKQVKSGKCKQCGRYEDEIMRFSDEEIYRCSYCMTVEGLCQNCGVYIPFPDDENGDYDMNFAPLLCDACSA